MYQISTVRASQDVKLAVRRYGHPDESDFAVLCIHGACVDAEFFHEMAEVLSSLCPVVTYDRRGYGFSSSNPQACYDLPIQADDAWQVMKATACEDTKWFVVAHSAGSGIGLELASAHSQRICGLLLHEPAMFDGLDETDPVFRVVSEAMTAADQGLVALPVYQLFSLERCTDVHARLTSEAAAKTRDANCSHFLVHEARVIQAYRLTEDLRRRIQGMSVLVGLGEQSSGTYHERNCPWLAQQLGGTLLFVPGGHNGLADLPLESACLIQGLGSYCHETSKEYLS